MTGVSNPELSAMLRRLRLFWGLPAVGTTVALLAWNRPLAASFALGSVCWAVQLAMLVKLSQLVLIAAGRTPPRRAWTLVFFGAGILLLGVGFAILRTFELPVGGILVATGVFLTTWVLERVTLLWGASDEAHRAG